MNFDQIVKTELDELLSAHGFSIEQSDDYGLHYKSSKVRISFYNDHRGYFCSYFIWHAKCDIAIENFKVEKFLKISRTPIFGTESVERKAKTWAQWIASYFKENQRGFLDGNDLFFKELNDFSNECNKKYTDDIGVDYLKSQIQEAWEKKDYFKLTTLKVTGVNGLSPSELKKIDFAIRKLGANMKIKSDKKVNDSFWQRFKSMFKI